MAITSFLISEPRHFSAITFFLISQLRHFHMFFLNCNFFVSLGGKEPLSWIQRVFPTSVLSRPISGGEGLYILQLFFPASNELSLPHFFSPEPTIDSHWEWNRNPFIYKLELLEAILKKIQHRLLYLTTTCAVFLINITTTKSFSS